MRVGKSTYKRVTGMSPQQRLANPYMPVAGNWTQVLVVPITLTNPLNKRMHWAAKSRMANKQKEAVWLAARIAELPPVADSQYACVHATRKFFGRQKPMDQNGLTASMKWVEDSLSEWLGVDDGDSRWTFIAHQMRVDSGELAGVNLAVVVSEDKEC